MEKYMTKIFLIISMVATMYKGGGPAFHIQEMPDMKTCETVARNIKEMTYEQNNFYTFNNQVTYRCVKLGEQND